MKTNHRRDFLKKSLLGVSGAALAPGVLTAAPLISNKNHIPELPKRILGKTGIKIPLLSMGTGDTNNQALFKGAHDNGVVCFATSSYYGAGKNEMMLGEVLKDLPRESYMVATSAMPKGTDHQNGLFTDATAGKSFKADIEDGMKRLGVDYLDILFLPFAAKRESVFFEPLLRVMEDFKSSGKARFIGIATHSYIDEAIRAAVDIKIYDVVMTAYNFRMAQQQSVLDAIAYGAEAGLGMIAMKSMAGGYWDRERTQSINSKAALKWVLQNPTIHTIMSGMTTFEELQSNLELVKDPTLTEEDLNDLKLADTGKSGLYCMQCRKCDNQCIHNVDIPTVMRGYMYAYGYRNLHHAQQTLNLAHLSDNPCNNCETCNVECSSGFDVKNKIQDIARLQNVPEDFLMV